MQPIITAGPVAMDLRNSTHCVYHTDVCTVLAARKVVA